MDSKNPYNKDEKRWEPLWSNLGIKPRSVEVVYRCNIPNCESEILYYMYGLRKHVCAKSQIGYVLGETKIYKQLESSNCNFKYLFLEYSRDVAKVFPGSWQKNWIVSEYVIKDVRLEIIISHINRIGNQTRFFLAWQSHLAEKI